MYKNYIYIRIIYRTFPYLHVQNLFEKITF